MLYFGKYGSGLLFIAELFNDSCIVEQFLNYGIYNFLANLRTDLAESLPVLLEAFFSHNINIEVVIDPLFDDFGGNDIVFFFFPNLKSSDRLSSRAIYYILYFFFFEYGLYEFGPLKPILKASKLLFLTFLFVIIVCHCGNGGR